MKTHRLSTVLCIFAMLAAVCGCETEYTTGTLRLQLSSEIQEESKTLIPADQSLDIYSYYIQGQGPNSKTFSVTTLSPQVMIEGLVLGTWTITATGQNAQGTNLVSGSTTHQLTTTATVANLVMETLVGTGTVDIGFSWNEPDFPGIVLKLFITAQGGTETQVSSGIVVDSATGTATYEASMASGSYGLRYELFSDGVKISGGTEALRVIDGGTTTGTILISLDKEGESAPGLSITTPLTTPVEGTITGVGLSILPNTPVTAQFNYGGGGGTPEVDVNWYLDGELLGTGLTTTFSTYTGSHRLDALAQTDRSGSIGSASFPFRASVLNQNGVPVAIAAYEAGDVDTAAVPYQLSSISDAVFMRDGKLLIASGNTLQLCKVVNDKLVVVRSFTDGGAGSSAASEAYPVQGISGITVDLLDDIVFTTASETKTVVLYQYDSATGNLVKLDHRIANDATYENWSQLGNPVIDSANDLIYFLDPQNDLVFYYRYDASDLVFLGLTQLESINSNALFTVPTHLEISTDSKWLGITCADNGTFHLLYNTLSGSTLNPLSSLEFSGKTTGEAAADLRGIIFRNQDFLACVASGITPYVKSSQSMAWTAGETVGQPLNNVASMVFDSSYTSMWAVSSGTTPGISLLSWVDNHPQHTGFVPTGTFTGKDIAISPLEDLLCVVGDDSDLMLFRLSDD